MLLLCSSVAPAAETVSQAHPENGTEQDWPSETDSYDEPVIDYDHIDLQLDLTTANDSAIDYELRVLGAVEATNETANGTVSCTDQRCLIDGDVGPNETASYNLSGLVLDVEPADNVTTAVNGTLEGDALVGLGLGAITEPRSTGSDEVEDVSDDEDVFGEAVPDETAVRDDLDEGSETRGTATDDTSYLVTFVTTADANRSDYAFTADGVVEPYQGDDYESPSGNIVRSVSNYDIDENGDEASVTGHTANGFGDAYSVTGAITDVTLDNEDAMWIEVNGTPVTPEELQAVTAGDLALTDVDGPPGLPPDPTGASIDVAELNVANVPPDEEYIVLENADDADIDLSGWTVRDREDDGRVANGWDPFEFPDGFTLDAG